MKDDFYFDYSKISSFIETLEDVKDKMDGISEKLTTLQDSVEEGEWLGLGHEHASLFLALLVKYCGYICGKTIEPNISAYGEKDASFDLGYVSNKKQGEGHLENAIKNLKKHKSEFEKFEKNGNGEAKAECVKKLDNIQ